MKSIKHEIRVLTRHTGRHKVVENVVLEKETFSFLCGKISFKSFSFFIFSISALVFLYFCIFVTKVADDPSELRNDQFKITSKF